MTGHLAFVGCLAGLMLLVAVITVRSGTLLRTWTPSRNLLLSWPDNLFRLLLVGLCIWIGWRLGPGGQALGWSTANLPLLLAWGTGAGLLLAAALSTLGWLVVKKWGEGIYSDRLLQCILPLERREWPGVILALLPAAALEELLFRSLPLAGLAWLWPGGYLLWPLSLFFGVLHWPQGWWGIAGTTLAAIALSLLFLATGSIWPPLAAHYIMNLSQIVLAKLTGIPPLRAR